MENRKWAERYSTDCNSKYQSEATRKNYKHCINQFLVAFDRYNEPKEVSTQEIKEWLLRFDTINTRRHLLSAIKSFYQLTVGMPNKIDKIPYPKKDKKLPEVIEESEIQAIIRVCTNKKHKAIIALLYGCGLRISEVINLKIEHLKESTIDIKLAKGRKDRIVPYPPYLKKFIEEYMEEYNPKEYLFNGWKNEPQYSERSINQFIKQLAEKAGIKKNIHAHLFRHSYATHNLERGVSLPFIQEILGHSKPTTTAIYLHTSRKSISNIGSPLESMIL